MHKMLSRNQAKMILSLQKKRSREEAGSFVIEGDKLVREYLMAGNRVTLLAAKSEWIAGESDAVLGMASEVVTVGYDELRKISSLKTPHNVLVVAPIVKNVFLEASLPGRLTLALEYVQDPGNLGTIIRIAAWFGIKNIICSPECVDIYNPKVLQATMGAFIHVNVHYTPLEPILERTRQERIPVYGTVIGGDSIYQKELATQGIILLGNESKGLTDRMLALVTDFITIPGPEKPLSGIESLNVSMAAAIICSEFARRK
ncbi:MAG TPA: RNA methyltransferase [Bacteroidales bacterium]|nr:RNA methyltransferase [Bacteroidales bacterium]